MTLEEYNQSIKHLNLFVDEKGTLRSIIPWEDQWVNHTPTLKTPLDLIVPAMVKKIAPYTFTGWIMLNSINFVDESGTEIKLRVDEKSRKVFLGLIDMYDKEDNYYAYAILNDRIEAKNRSSRESDTGRE